MKMSSAKKLGIIIIAAGNSSRLGQAKQLVEISGTSLLQIALSNAEELSNYSVCILGHDANRFESKLERSSCKILVNESWLLGMGSSIACGVNFFMDKVDAVMILLCDQYRLTLADLTPLIEQWHNEPDKIIASRYLEKKCNRLIEGAPAIFPNRYFDSLVKLEEKGARDILNKNRDNVVVVSLDNAAFDLDTADDLKVLYKMSGEQQ